MNTLKPSKTQSGVCIQTVRPHYGKDERWHLDFHPRRSFKSTKHVVLSPEESWLNLQYPKFFSDCDQADIQVVVHCTCNFLPIASVISHRVVLQKTRNMRSSVFHPGSYLNQHGLQCEAEKAAFGIRQWDMGIHADPMAQSLLPPSAEEMEALIAFFATKAIAVEVEAFPWFERHRGDLPKEIACVELKCRWSRGLMARFAWDNYPTVIGADEVFQYGLLERFGCDVFFLSVQLLVGIFNRWSFIALHGASSVFSTLLPVNLLFVINPEDLPADLKKMRSCINQHNYGAPTVGAKDLRAGFEVRVGFICRMGNRLAGRRQRRNNFRLGLALGQN